MNRFNIQLSMLLLLFISISDATAQGVKGNRKLRFDGFYNTFDTIRLECGQKANERYVTDRFLAFRENGTVFYDGGGTLDSAAYRLGYFKSYHRATLGKYRIQGDTIYAQIPTTFFTANLSAKAYLTNYRGIIKSGDTIIDWKMVPPYPKAKSKYNWYFKEELQPKLQYFIKSSSVNDLD